MLTCLKNTVGIKWCGGDSNPASGFFINSMAGVTIKMMEKLTTEESNTFALVWSDIQDRAARRMSQAIQQEFSKRYRIKNIQRSVNLEKKIDLTSVTAAAPEYRGLYFDDNYFISDDEIKLSALQNHHAQVLYFYSLNAVSNVDIKVFDCELNTVLETFTQDIAIGWNTIQTHKDYSAYKIFIGVDCTSIDTVDLILPSNTENFPVRIRGGKFTIGSDISTLQPGNNSYGLSGIFSVKCKFDNIICSNIDLFTTAYSNYCASELMLERLASNRWNFITTSTKQAEEMKAHYDVEAEKSIEIACSGIDLDESDICLDCGDSLQIKETNFYA